MSGPTYTHDWTRGVLHAAGRVCAEAVGADAYVFAASLGDDTQTELAPMVVDPAVDFTEQQFPVVTLTLGPWSQAVQPGIHRIRFTLNGIVWRELAPIDVNTLGLLSDRDALAEAFIAHGKAFSLVPDLEDAVLKAGPGIRPRSVPRADFAAGAGDRVLLTLPFSVEIVCNRLISPQPA